MGDGLRGVVVVDVRVTKESGVGDKEEIGVGKESLP